MDPLEDPSSWDFLDYSLLDDAAAIFSPGFNRSCSELDGAKIDVSGGDNTVVSEEIECPRKRARNDSCCKPSSKACREKLRRERLNDGFRDLSATLESRKPAKTDKLAVLDDAIRVLNQLRNEAQELKETNEKLEEEGKSLKVEKKELREEKMTLKAEKQRIEQQLKVMAMPPTGLMPSHPPTTACHHAAANKLAVFPGYGYIPMWQYLPPPSCDTSHDHELRPPAA